MHYILYYIYLYVLLASSVPVLMRIGKFLLGIPLMWRHGKFCFAWGQLSEQAIYQASLKHAVNIARCS